MKVGIIRCQQTEIHCPATTCLSFASKGEGAIKETGPVEVIAVAAAQGSKSMQEQWK